MKTGKNERCNAAVESQANKAFLNDLGSVFLGIPLFNLEVWRVSAEVSVHPVTMCDTQNVWCIPRSLLFSVS